MKSKGAQAETMVRSNVAIALGMVSAVTPSPGKTASNRLTYQGMACRAATAFSIGMFISTSAVIGPMACCSRVSARPSQKNTSLQAWFITVGLCLPSGFSPSPRPVGLPSCQPKLALWQDAQDRACDPDRRGSKNSTFPSSAFSGV